MAKYGLILLILMNTAFSQDEREFRKLFSIKTPTSKAHVEPKYVLKSDVYQYDLDHDQVPEQLQIVQKDGLQYLHILNHEGSLLREVNFQAKGIKAELFKVRSTYIKPGVLSILLYFNEGYTESVRYRKTARIYILTVKSKNWRDSRLFKGASFFLENQGVHKRYYQRPYFVNILDYNKDGVKEISVSYDHIQRIYYYQNDSWKEFL